MVLHFPKSVGKRILGTILGLRPESSQLPEVQAGEPFNSLSEAK
jgi:hypothetical protein